MTASTTTAPRRRPTTGWMLILAAALLISVLSVALVTSRSPVIVPAGVQPEPPVFSAEQHETAEALASARFELAAARAVVTDVPAVADSMRDRMTLLRLVATNQVPVQTLGAQ